MADASSYFHDVLTGLEDIAEVWPGPCRFEDGLLNVGAAHPVLRRGRIFHRHWNFAGSLQTADERELRVVREFSNVPLAVSLWMKNCFPTRLSLMMHHNLQWACMNRTEAAALRFLVRRGISFVFMEQVPTQAMVDLGLNTDRCCAIPLPVANLTPPVSAEPSSRFTVGLMGSWGPERGHERALGVLLEMKEVSGIVIGVPNPGSVPECRDPRIQVVDTSSPQAFDRAIRACDAVVLNYGRSQYENRASGLVSDAAARCVPVLVPDFPVLRHQVSSPVQVGEVFASTDEMEKGLLQIKSASEAGAYDFQTYIRERTVETCVQDLVRELEALNV